MTSKRSSTAMKSCAISKTPACWCHINAFAQTLRLMRATLKQAEAAPLPQTEARAVLDAVDAYCGAVASPDARPPADADLRSRGLLAFRDYLAGYASSDRFTSLLAETKGLKADLLTVKYALLIKGGEMTVRKYDRGNRLRRRGRADIPQIPAGRRQGLQRQVFRLAANEPYRGGRADRVARLYPDIFAQLGRLLPAEREVFSRPRRICSFDWKPQFYVAYLAYLEPLRRAGLSLCYPALSQDSKELCVCDAFDLALAHKLAAERASVVCNDFYLRDAERIFVISGPNQGRQDHVRPHVRATPLFGEPRLSRSRPQRAPLSPRSLSSPISSARRPSTIFAANCRTT